MTTSPDMLNHADLIAQLEQLRRGQVELEQKRYADACIARFSELMRWQNDSSLNAWAQRLLDELSKEFNALQSALYRLLPDAEVLEYTGGFATHAVTETRVPLGAGLVGQVGQSRRALYLTHDTGIDTQTHSSLARLQLRGLAILPLLYNQQLQGVLELATLDPLSRAEQNLLEALMQVLAANLSSIGNQARLQSLLQEAQESSNRLLAQEEELRQNLEELEATQEEMRRVQQAMQHTNREFQNQLQALDRSTAMVELSLDGVVLNANTEFLRISGYSLDQLKGQPHRNVVPEAFANSAAYRDFWATLRRGEFVRGEFERLRPDGSSFWIQGSYNPIVDASGKPEKVVKFCLDITEQKRQEAVIRNAMEELQASEEEIRQNSEELQAQHEEMRRLQTELQGQIGALNHAAIVSEADVRGDIIFANDEFVRISQYSREELHGQNHRIVKGGNQPQSIFVELWAAISKGKVWRGELQNKAKDGSYYWVAATITPVIGIDGKPVKYIGVRFDITLQKNQEEQVRQALEEVQASEEELRQNAEELQAQHEEMRRVQLELQNMTRSAQQQLTAIDRSMAVVELGLDGTVLAANAEFQRISGYTEAQLKGQPHRNVVPAAYAASEAYAAFWRGLRAGEFQRGEFERVRPDGSSFWIQGSYNPVLDAEGRVVKVTKYCFDITAQKNQEAQVRQAFEELQATEEELRQNSEELQAQHEEMRRVQVELQQLTRSSQQQLTAIDRSMAVVELGLDGTVLAANAEFLRISGYTETQLVGQPHRNVLPAAYAQSAAYMAFWQALRRGEFQRGEFERLRPDGSSFWIQGSYNPVLDADGRVLKVTKYCFDITAQKQQEAQVRQAYEELQATEEELRQNSEELAAQHEDMQRVQNELQVVSKRLLNQLQAIDRSTAVVELSMDGTVLHANAQFLRISGYTSEQLLGHAHRELVPKAYASSTAYQYFWDALRRGEFQQGEFERLRPDGTSFWIAGSYNPVPGADGKLEKVVKFCVDITQQKDQQAQYRQAIDELQAAEEEVRQNAEELTAQHEEMRRMQIELQGQIGALNNAAIVSEANVAGDIIFCNDEFVRLSKYSREELLGQNHRIVKGGNQPQRLFVDLWATISKGKVWRGELQNKAKDGSYYWVAATITPVMGIDGKPVKYVGVRFEITALKEAEAKLLGAGNAMDQRDTATDDPQAATPDPELSDALRTVANGIRPKVRK